MTLPALDQIVGQLFMVGFKGGTVSPFDQIYKDIAERNLGGVILFDRHLASDSAENNILGPAQLSRLTEDLQSIRTDPLFIAVDQEGGRVNRFRQEFGFPVFPRASELGETPDTQATTAIAEKLARMLKVSGVNFNLAPVVDVNRNPQNPIIGRIGRSFSSDPETVARKSAAWIKAHQKARVLSCLKHFPGHGSSVDDSHLGFVDISKYWHRDELIPYERLIASGCAEAVMLGHLFNDYFDPELPASLSAGTVSYLRKHLNFEGAVISDDMQMRAITDRFGLEEACVMALQAGVDMLIIGNNLSYDPHLFTRVHAKIVSAVDNGDLDQALITGAWERIQKLKSSL